MCKKDKVERLKTSLGFAGMVVVEAQGHKGGIAFLWRYAEEAQLMNFSTSHIDLVIESRGSPKYRLTGLYELHGYPYTWERGRNSSNLIEIRLDRALANSSWIHSFPEAILSNHEISTSDHCPIILSPIPNTRFSIVRRFKFENAWLREPMCRQIVEEVWQANRHHPIQKKLAICAEVLGPWGQDITGSFRRRLDQCNRTLKLLKPLHDSHSTKKFQEASSSLFEILTQQEVFWKQRSKQLWLREGDLNSKYFHASARTRRRANHIESLRNDTGEMVDWRSGLEHLMVEYFQTLFKSSVDEWNEVVSRVVPTITPSQNAMLLAPIEDDEVKSALFHMHPDKSPGPDGMSPGFYQMFWPIVGQDVIHEMKKF
ncbi:uncharacterized protein LOC133814696 [Humulus lupulus]|uniref:uncharacterized protein LOC133814696 n=1 Tax=Humulus lupulus TaxID=3486 RepID=UPI002B41062B|nr:uncharacterized protein LOC133814696 [Humulus lupulus]